MGVEDLNRQFGIPGLAEVVSGNGGLPKVRISSRLCTGEIYLHGAHVTSWVPAGKQEVIFVSKESKFENGKAIRGGIPICFPWFGPKADDPAAPAHGLVRSKSWELKSIKEANGAVTVSLDTSSGDDTRRWSPADFHVTHKVTFGAELDSELIVENTGTTPFTFAEALHTYYSVGEIKDAMVHGLEETKYIDKTRNGEVRTQDGAVSITEETDRVYLDTKGTAQIEDPVLKRRIDIQARNSRTTVVWNPWITKSKSFTDFGDEEWHGMVCVETCNVADFSVTLDAGMRHMMSFHASVTHS